MNNNKTIEYQYLYFKKFSGQSWFIYKGIAQNGLITHFMAQTSENSPRVYGKSEYDLINNIMKFMIKTNNNQKIK